MGSLERRINRKARRSARKCQRVWWGQMAELINKSPLRYRLRFAWDAIRRRLAE